MPDGLEQRKTHPASFPLQPDVLDLGLLPAEAPAEEQSDTVDVREFEHLDRNIDLSLWIVGKIEFLVRFDVLDGEEVNVVPILPTTSTATPTGDGSRHERKHEHDLGAVKSRNTTAHIFT